MFIETRTRHASWVLHPTGKPCTQTFGKPTLEAIGISIRVLIILTVKDRMCTTGEATYGVLVYRAVTTTTSRRDGWTRARSISSGDIFSVRRSV